MAVRIQNEKNLNKVSGMPRQTAPTGRSSYVQAPVRPNTKHQVKNDPEVIIVDGAFIDAVAGRKAATAREKAAKTAPAKKHFKYANHVKFLLCSLSVLFCCALILCKYVENYDLNVEKSRLERQLAAAADTNTYLTMRFDTMYSLEEIENYAVNHLGMVKTDKSQITYVSIPKTDKAVVLTADESEQSGGIFGLLSTILEYLQ